MCDECAYQLRVACDQIKPDKGPGAAAKYIRRFSREFSQQTVGIVAMYFQRYIFNRVVERAAQGTPAIIGDNGVSVGEMVDETVPVTATATTTTSYHKQEWSRSAYLVVEVRARYAQRIAFCKTHQIFSVSLMHIERNALWLEHTQKNARIRKMLFIMLRIISSPSD